MRSPAEGPRWRDRAAPRCVVRRTSLHGHGREPGKRERSATASCAVERSGTPCREREATRRAARCRKQRDPRWHTSRSDTRGDHDMHLRYALLALLAEGEAHGYQLLKLFNQRLGPFWHPNIGQVYQLLHELERRGLVVRRDQAFGTRLRRLFRLTPRGERALGTWLTRRPGWPPPLADGIFVGLLAPDRPGALAGRTARPSPVRATGWWTSRPSAGGANQVMVSSRSP